MTPNTKIPPLKSITNDTFTTHTTQVSSIGNPKVAQVTRGVDGVVVDFANDLTHFPDRKP